ncbi:hypothetical protein [Pseudoneobacillus sp. C159]
MSSDRLGSKKQNGVRTRHEFRQDEVKMGFIGHEKEQIVTAKALSVTKKSKS